MKPTELTEAYSIDGDDMSWMVNCPNCDKYYEYIGFFDSSDITNCKCGCNFKVSKLWLNENQFIR